MALMMVWEADSVLQDRFRSARDHFVEMFPRGRRPGKSYQGFVKAQAKISPAMKRTPAQAQSSTARGEGTGNSWKDGLARVYRCIVRAREKG